MNKKDIYKLIREGKNWEAAEALTAFLPVKIEGPQDIVDLFNKYAFKKKEYFFMASLASDMSVIATHEVSCGVLNHVPYHPREVFRPAILDNAYAIVIGHNHPSGSLELSVEDEKMIDELRNAGELLGIPVLDHVLITRKGATSYVSTQGGECDSDS
jgi:DNA repair protein RadC